MVTYSGSQVLVAVKTDDSVAFTDAAPTTDVSFEMSRELTEVYKHGSPAPQELKSGHYTVSGTITRDFTTGNFSATGMTFFAMATGTTEMYVALFPEGDASPKILLSNVKFSDYQIKAPLKGQLTESCKFKGLAISIS